MKSDNYKILIIALLLAGCHSAAEKIFTPKGEAIHKKLIDAHCKMEHLREQSAQLWDSLVIALSTSLPPNMPSDERKNMLQVRSAELIRMFEVFPRLPDSVRFAVERAALRDQELAARMKVEMNRIDQYEAESFAFLQEIEMVSADSAAVWQERFSTLPCRKKQKIE